MTDFDFDAPIQRPEPDREVVARAFNDRLSTEAPIEKYVRQQWETAVAATRVAMDAWRDVWPKEVADLTADEELRAIAQEVAQELEQAFHGLDKLSELMLGTTLYEAQLGRPEGVPDELET